MFLPVPSLSWPENLPEIPGQQAADAPDEGIPTPELTGHRGPPVCVLPTRGGQFPVSSECGVKPNLIFKSDLLPGLPAHFCIPCFPRGGFDYANLLKEKS